jgi:hypothetical protein
VVLDGKVQEVANIKEAIRDTGTISGGSMNQQQAKDLSMILRSGALPAGIKYLEERTVGPSLGTDSIRAGVRAAVVGMLAVLIFMLIYYRAAGINADIALLLNLIILLGFMGYFDAVLTLARNRRSDPYRRHGCGLQCADFRAHSRGITQREDATIRRGSGISVMPGSRSWIRTLQPLSQPQSCSCSEPAPSRVLPSPSLSACWQTCSRQYSSRA